MEGAWQNKLDPQTPESTQMVKVMRNEAIFLHLPIILQFYQETLGFQSPEWGLLTR
jgi:hypothetical protein